MRKKIEYTECLDFVSNKMYQRNFSELIGMEQYYAKCEAVVEMGKRIKKQPTPEGSINIKSVKGLIEVFKKIGASKISKDQVQRSRGTFFRLKIDGSEVRGEFYGGKGILIDDWCIPIGEPNSYDYIKMVLLATNYSDEDSKKTLNKLYPIEH